MAHLIAIEGTDCSGKGTQSVLLMERIEKLKGKAKLISYPRYDTPTGKIIGGAYLGKEHIGKPLFPEGATNVDGKVASLLFAADRKYNDNEIKENLKNGYNVILNRYVESNMGHQASKFESKEEREKMFEFLEKLEYDLLELSKPELTILLYMPNKYSKILKQGREEKADQHELDEEYLLRSEKTYLEMVQKYNFCKIDCVENDRILSPEEISEKVWVEVQKRFPDII